MKILAIEFSSEKRSAAFLDTETQRAGAAEEIGGRNVFSLVEKALAQGGVEREEIELIAVGLGPGSYTGIRAALAVAQGWQMALGAKTMGVSSVEALAIEAAQSSQSGPLNIVIDAQRGEFYLARYEINAGAAQVIEPLRLAARSEVEALNGQGLLIGPEAAKHFSLGNDWSPAAMAVARLSAVRPEFVSAERLEPIYLRLAEFKKAPPPRRIP